MRATPLSGAIAEEGATRLRGRLTGSVWRHLLIGAVGARSTSRKHQKSATQAPGPTHVAWRVTENSEV